MGAIKHESARCDFVAADFTAIRGAEKILEPGEDWRVLGTNDDPAVKETLVKRSTE